MAGFWFGAILIVCGHCGRDLRLLIFGVHALETLLSVDSFLW